MRAKKQLPQIVQDTREQKPLKFSDKVEVIVGTLENGDYTLLGYEDKVWIERKGIVDLFGSIILARFQRCLERVKDYPYKFIVVEASLLDIFTKKNWALKQRVKIPSAAIIGKLISMQINDNVHVQYCDDTKMTAKFVEHLCCYLWAKFKKEEKKNVL